jgi:RNA-binding protein NOB1
MAKSGNADKISAQTSHKHGKKFLESNFHVPTSKSTTLCALSGLAINFQSHNTHHIISLFAMADSPASTKSVHTIVLDAGPLLKNVPPLSTLLAQAEELVTTPAVVGEIRDPDARARVETLYLPFLKQRSPSPKSVQVISEFSRKTGDRAVLSKVDIEILALAYEIECERNGGDWRLRSVPGQKRVNGKAPVKEAEKQEEGTTEGEKLDSAEVPEAPQSDASKTEVSSNIDTVTSSLEQTDLNGKAEQENGLESAEEVLPATDSTENDTVDADELQDEGEDSDGGGEWITPSNIKKKQAKDESANVSTAQEQKVMQVATMTTDFAVSLTHFFHVPCSKKSA